jgi:hypothetical protein
MVRKADGQYCQSAPCVREALCSVHRRALLLTTEERVGRNDCHTSVKWPPVPQYQNSESGGDVDNDNESSGLGRTDESSGEEPPDRHSRKRKRDSEDTPSFTKRIQNAVTSLFHSLFG